MSSAPTAIFGTTVSTINGHSLKQTVTTGELVNWQVRFSKRKKKKFCFLSLLDYLIRDIKEKTVVKNVIFQFHKSWVNRISFWDFSVILIFPLESATSLHLIYEIGNFWNSQMGVLKSLIDVVKSSHDSYWSTVFYCICRVDDQSLFHDFDWGVIQMSTSFFAQKYCSNYLYNGISLRGE